MTSYHSSDDDLSAEEEEAWMIDHELDWASLIECAEEYFAR
jgi:hypothetical protein